MAEPQPTTTRIIAPAFEAWAVSEARFPADSTDAAKLRFLVHYAVLAPSGHNSQPWLFDVVDDTLELWADRNRALPVVDPDDRELVISCGAALANVRVALRHFGYEGSVEILPQPGDDDLLARVRLGDPATPTGDDQAAFAAIPRRRTNRRIYDDRPVPDEVLAQLEADARCEGAWLHVVHGDDARLAVGDLVAEADHLQWADRRFRREIASWIHPNRSARRSGMRGYALGLKDLQSHTGPFVMRTFDLGKGKAARDRQIAQGSPVLAVLGTDGDTQADWIATGQALERVLLRARTHDVWGAFLNQPVEMPEVRPRLAGALGRNGFPQLVLRMGYGPEPRLEPRRPAIEVMFPPAESTAWATQQPVSGANAPR